MRDFVIIDSSKFPIVIAKYSGFIPTKEEFLHAQKTCETFFEHHSDFVFLVDLSDVVTLPNEYRIAQARWVERLRPLHMKQKIRFAFYTPLLATQLMMKTLFVIGTPGVPYTVCSTLEKAYAWAAEQLGDAK